METTPAQTTSALHKLVDTELTVARRAEDVRGRKVVDRHGEEIGTIDELMVDDAERKVRFLVVSTGGFLGLGATKFLIPVDAITRVEDEQVRVDQTRAHLAKAPAYQPELVERRAYQEAVYQHYGYAPFWAMGYAYPPFPYYPGRAGPFV